MTDEERAGVEEIFKNCIALKLNGEVVISEQLVSLVVLALRYVESETLEGAENRKQAKERVSEIMLDYLSKQQRARSPL